MSTTVCPNRGLHISERPISSLPDGSLSGLQHSAYLTDGSKCSRFLCVSWILTWSRSRKNWEEVCVLLPESHCLSTTEGGGCGGPPSTLPPTPAARFPPLCQMLYWAGRGVLNGCDGPENDDPGHQGSTCHPPERTAFKQSKSQEHSSTHIYTFMYITVHKDWNSLFHNRNGNSKREHVSSAMEICKHSLLNRSKSFLAHFHFLSDPA